VAKKGTFGAQLNAIEKLLKKLHLFDARNEWVKYSSDIPGLVRDLTYVDEYRHYLNSQIYDFGLVDRSLLQFKHHSDDDVSYCYYQVPVDAPTYQDFLASEVGIDPSLVESVGESFYEEYELAVDTARLRKSITPIRYDYTPKLYEHGVHPAAHIHIGSGNDIRLSARRLMEPMSFVLFVVRQMYPESWRLFLEMKDAPVICRAVREDIPHVREEYFQLFDSLQLVLE
jgi:hypothetical protein